MTAEIHTTTRRDRRLQSTCQCEAYPFPHRLYGGLCRDYEPVTFDWHDRPARNMYRLERVK